MCDLVVSKYSCCKAQYFRPGGKICDNSAVHANIMRTHNQEEGRL